MAPKGSHKVKGKARAKMPTLVINRCRSLGRDCIQGFISEHIRGLILIYHVCGVKDERAWDLLYNIIFLDPVTSRHFSQLQLMWPHRRSRSSPLREWWAAFRSYMAQMNDKTRNQWRWDNPRDFGDHADRSNPRTTSSLEVQPTGEHCSSYGGDDLRAEIEPPSRQLFKPSDLLAITPLNWDEMIDENDDDENRADPGALSGGWSHPGDGNDNNDGKGDEDTHGGEKGTGKGKGTKDGTGKGMG